MNLAAIRLMQASGGSFVGQLATTYFVADDNNRAKLVAAFPEIFQRYEQAAQAVAAKEVA